MLWQRVVTAIALLLVLSSLANLDDSSGVLFEIAGEKISIRDLILILGGLQFFPALALGPIVEHVLMHASATF